jgi:hypothetical protein
MNLDYVGLLCNSLVIWMLARLKDAVQLSEERTFQ